MDPDLRFVCIGENSIGKGGLIGGELHMGSDQKSMCVCTSGCGDGEQS